MNILTIAVILALPALAAAGYRLRGVVRQRTAEVFAAAAGAITLVPVLCISPGILPSWLQAMLPTFVAASMILGALWRNHDDSTAPNPGRTTRLATVICLSVAAITSCTIGVGIITQCQANPNTSIWLEFGATTLILFGALGMVSAVWAARSRD